MLLLHPFWYSFPAGNVPLKETKGLCIQPNRKMYRTRKKQSVELSIDLQKYTSRIEEKIRRVALFHENFDRAEKNTRMDEAKAHFSSVVG